MLPACYPPAHAEFVDFVEFADFFQEARFWQIRYPKCTPQSLAKMQLQPIYTSTCYLPATPCLRQLRQLRQPWSEIKCAR